MNETRQCGVEFQSLTSSYRCTRADGHHGPHRFDHEQGRVLLFDHEEPPLVDQSEPAPRELADLITCRGFIRGSQILYIWKSDEEYRRMLAAQFGHCIESLDSWFVYVSSPIPLTDPNARDSNSDSKQVYFSRRGFRESAAVAVIQPYVDKAVDDGSLVRLSAGPEAGVLWIPPARIQWFGGLNTPGHEAVIDLGHVRISVLDARPLNHALGVFY